MVLLSIYKSVCRTKEAKKELAKARRERRQCGFHDLFIAVL